MSRPLTLAAAALLWMGGCAFTDHSRPAAHPPATAPVAVTQLTEPPSTQPAPPPIKDADALAGTITAHTKAMQDHVDRRAKAISPASPESPIQWLDPQPYRLDLMPPQDPRGPSPVPVDNTTVVPVVMVKNTQPQTQPAVLKTLSPPASAPPSESLERDLANRIKDDPANLAAQLDYQLLQMLRGQAVPRMDAISTLPAEDRELIAALMDALSNLRGDAHGDQSLLMSRKARPLIELADRLRAQTNLRIPAVSLCTRVQGFGLYDPIDAARLPAARENQVIIYCEVENFSSRLNDRGLWETDLTLDAALYNDRGQRVWSDKRQTVADLSRNRRRDFFVPRKVFLPALPPGQYSMTVTIADQQANRMIEATLAVQTVLDLNK